MNRNVVRKNLFAEKKSFKTLPQKITINKNSKISFLETSDNPPYLSDDHWLWEWPFQNKYILQDKKLIRTISQNEIINKLNHIHFIDSSVLVHLENIHDHKKILIPAKIVSCSETVYKFHLREKTSIDINIKNFLMLHIVIDDSKALILMPALLIEQKIHSFSIQIPEMGYIICQRQVRRHRCYGINVDLFQNNFRIKGTLIDFSPLGMRIQLASSDSSLFDQFNHTGLISVTFYSNKDDKFSNICKFIRQETFSSKRKDIVLLPIDNDSNIKKTSNIRNPRLNLTPLPALIFKHPLLKKEIHLNIINISSSGICVYEEVDESVLTPGMIISKGKIAFSDTRKINCSLKIVYRLRNENKMQSGLSILDINLNSYNQLMKILTNALDANVYYNSTINIEKLWEFFFNVNFIYPKKYHYIRTIRKDIQKTYNSLYKRCPEISMHFTYQKNERIYGHFSALHAYENTWIQHHHAAKIVDNRPIGFFMLKHMIHYFKDIYRFPSIRIKYLMGYYRPDNKFPEKIFGGFCRDLSNRKICSIDLFAYVENRYLALFKQLQKGWILRPATESDLKTFNTYYEEQSGGLLLEALGVAKTNFDYGFMETLYKMNSLSRKLRIYALCFYDEVYAILFMEQSNPGLNFSDLLNNIKTLIIKPEKLPWKILSNAIAQLISKYKMGFIPILIYPIEYVKMNNIPNNKQYQLWICHIEHYYRIAEYLQAKFKLTYWN